MLRPRNESLTPTITRRKLLTATGVALAGGLAVSGLPPQASAQASPPASKPRGKGRSFIGDEGFRNAVHDGKKGFILKVRLTSYRSLPLSCIKGIQLKIDGDAVDPAVVIFTLNNYSHKLDELPKLSKVWWFILDYAELFVPHENGLAPGEHDVEGTLITVEPYMTAGRFASYSPSKKRLLLEPDN